MGDFGAPGEYFEKQDVLIGAYVFVFTDTLTKEALDYYEKTVFGPLAEKADVKFKQVSTVAIPYDEMFEVPYDHDDMKEVREAIDTFKKETGHPALFEYRSYVYDYEKGEFIESKKTTEGVVEEYA